MKHDWKIIWVTPKLIHISPPLNIILKKLPANSSILDFPQEKKKRTYSKKDLRWLLDEKAFTSLYDKHLKILWSNDVAAYFNGTKFFKIL